MSKMGDQEISPRGSSLILAMNKVKPYLAMVSLQFGYAGMYVISLVSLNHGMNHYVLSVYRHIIAVLVIAPFAFVLERCVQYCMLALHFFLSIIDTYIQFIIEYVPFTLLSNCTLLSGFWTLLQENKAEDDTAHLLKNNAAWFSRVML